VSPTTAGLTLLNSGPGWLDLQFLGQGQLTEIVALMRPNPQINGLSIGYHSVLGSFNYQASLTGAPLGGTFYPNTLDLYDSTFGNAGHDWYLYVSDPGINGGIPVLVANGNAGPYGIYAPDAIDLPWLQPGQTVSFIDATSTQMIQYSPPAQFTRTACVLLADNGRLYTAYGLPETLSSNDSLTWTVRGAGVPLAGLGLFTLLGTNYVLPENSGYTFTLNGTYNGAPDVTGVIANPSTYDASLPAGSYTRAVSVTDSGGGSICATQELRLTVQ
jgi:hypothetical protein